MSFTSSSRSVLVLQVTLTVAAAAGFLIGFRMVRGMMASPPIGQEQAGLTDRSPAGPSVRRAARPRLPWPRYPGARQLHVGASRSYQGNSVVEFLEVPGSLDSVLDWYRRRLSRQGWTTNISGRDPGQGQLSVPTETLRENLEVFQQERILRLIDNLQTQVLVLRRRKQLILIAAEPTETRRRQNIRLVHYDFATGSAPPRSTYAEQYQVPAPPFRQSFGDDEMVTRAVASPLSPEAYLAQWKSRLGQEGWQEAIGGIPWRGGLQVPGMQGVVFTRMEEGIILAVHPGPDNGTLGLMTRIQRSP